MTEVLNEPRAEAQDVSPWVVRRRSIHAASVVLSSLSMLICAHYTGATLGLFIGGLVLASIIAPSLTSCFEKDVDRLRSLLVIVAGIASSWLLACISTLSASSLIAAAFILLTYSFALIGLSGALSRLVGDRVIASASITLLSLASMAFPFWCSATSFSSDAIQRMIAINPVFQIDGQSPQLDVWTQRPVLYSITSLGQDVPYALPKSIWMETGGWMIVGIVTGSLSRIKKRSAPAR